MSLNILLGKIILNKELIILFRFVLFWRILCNLLSCTPDEQFIYKNVISDAQIKIDKRSIKVRSWRVKWGTMHWMCQNSNKKKSQMRNLYSFRFWIFNLEKFQRKNFHLLVFPSSNVLLISLWVSHDNLFLLCRSRYIRKRLIWLLGGCPLTWFPHRFMQNWKLLFFFVISLVVKALTKAHFEWSAAAWNQWYVLYGKKF